MERNTIIRILEKLQLYILSFSIFYSVIIYIPILQNNYNLPKLFIIYSGAFLCIGLEAFKLFLSRKNIYFETTDLLILFFFLSNALALLFSFNQTVSFWGEYQSEGLDFFSVLSYISIAWVASRLFRRKLETIFYFYLGGTYLAALFAIYKHFITHTRPYGLEGQPIVSAGVIGLGLILLLKYIFIEKKYIFLLFATVYIAAIYVLDSTTTIASLLGTLTLYVTILAISYSKKARIKYFVLLCLLISIGIFIAPKLISKESFSLQRRIAQYQAVGKVIQSSMFSPTLSPKNILFGLGQYGSGYVFKQYRSPILNQSNEWNWELIRIQNHFIEVFVTTGFIGLIAWLLPFILVLLYLSKTRQYLRCLPIFYILCWQVLYYLPPVLIVMGLICTIRLLPKEYIVKKKLYFRKIGSFILIIYFFVLAIWGIITCTKLLRADLAIAKDSFKDAIALAPQNGEYVRQTAQDYILQVDMLEKSYQCLWSKTCSSRTRHDLYMQGRAYAEQAVKINPNRAINWYTYNVLVFHQYLDELPKKKEEAQLALNLITTAHRLDPSNPEFVDSKGQIYLDLQEYKQAEKYFLQAIVLKRDYIQSYRHLREVYFQTHQIQKLKKTEEEIRKLTSS